MSRRSVRAFKSTPVSRETLETLLERAKWAPSGGNLQPWTVHVMTGAKIEALSAKIGRMIKHLPNGTGGDYQIYPDKLAEPYRTRRFECGSALYNALGIERSDKARRAEQFAENFRFFGAPVSLFITIDGKMQLGQWSDLGMFIQTFMLLATEAGLGTCAQEAWSVWTKAVGEAISIQDGHMLFCGVAVGYEDKDRLVNQWRTKRAGLDEFVQWHGW
ncbi:MAG: nitroreductase [Gammaproteobacteria bacterium]